MILLQDVLNEQLPKPLFCPLLSVNKGRRLKETETELLTNKCAADGTGSSSYGAFLIIHLVWSHVISDLDLKLRGVCDFVQSIDAFHLVHC